MSGRETGNEKPEGDMLPEELMEMFDYRGGDYDDFEEKMKELMAEMEDDEYMTKEEAEEELRNSETRYGVTVFLVHERCKGKFVKALRDHTEVSSYKEADRMLHTLPRTFFYDTKEEAERACEALRGYSCCEISEPMNKKSGAGT